MRPEIEKQLLDFVEELATNGWNRPFKDVVAEARRLHEMVKPPPHPRLAEYEAYYDRCEQANRIPLAFDEWLKQINR